MLQRNNYKELSGHKIKAKIINTTDIKYESNHDKYKALKQYFVLCAETEATHTNIVDPSNYYKVNDEEVFFNKLNNYCEQNKKWSFFPFIENRQNMSNFVLYFNYDKIKNGDIIDTCMFDDNIKEIIETTYKTLCDIFNTKASIIAYIHKKLFLSHGFVRVHFCGVLLNTYSQLILLEDLISQIESIIPDAHICSHFEIGTTTMTPQSPSWQYHYSYLCNFNERNRAIITPNKSDCSKIVSINTATDTELVNESSTELSAFIELKSSSDSALLTNSVDINSLLINDHELHFYYLILKYLPDEYYRCKDKWREIIATFKLYGRKNGILKNEANKMKQILLHCTQTLTKEEFELEFEDYRNKNKNLEYYCSVIKESSKKVDFYLELEDLIQNYVTYTCYAERGKIQDSHIVKILHYILFGKFISVNINDSVNKCNAKEKYTCYEYIDKHDDAKIEFAHKWKIASALEAKIMYYIETDVADILNRVALTLKTDINSSEKKKDGNYKKKKNATKTAFLNSKNNLCKNVTINQIANNFAVKAYNNMFAERIDSDPYIIGVKNGILDLDLFSDNPMPKLYSQYSPHIVTKFVNAEYYEYDENNTYIKEWEQIYIDTIREDDARIKIQYINSTSLDYSANKPPCLQEIGCGANGKSVINDNIQALLKDYACKSPISLLTTKSHGGSADPELMALEGKRFTLFSETSKGDILDSSRLKTLTEKFKCGRSLYMGMKNFIGGPTIKINTNYALTITDSDDGTWRRILMYRYKNKFLTNPNLNNADEKQANVKYSTYVTDDKCAANALLSCLVKWRVEFQRLYCSDTSKVKSETIDNESRIYKCEQDHLTKFLHTHIVIIAGFDDNGNIKNGMCFDDILALKSYENIVISDKISIEKIAQEYVNWCSKLFNKKINIDTAIKELKDSRFGKYICEIDGKEFVIGKRLLLANDSRMCDEYYLML